MQKDNTTSEPNLLQARYWPARLGVGIIMLILAFIGLVVTYIEPITARVSWYYWISIMLVFAILSIGFSWYLRSKKIRFLTNIWQDILLWIGMLIAGFVLHVAINAGFIGRVEAGVFFLDLLAFATFCAGIMLDSCFLLIGTTLFIFSLIMIVFEKYLSIVLLGVVVVAVITLYFLAKGSKK